MAEQRFQDIFHANSRICFEAAGQTLDLTTDYPHGGTELGYISAISFAPNHDFAPITAEEFGNEAVDYLYLGSTGGLAMLMRQWDAEALSLIFPQTTTETDGTETILHPGSLRAGDLLASSGKRLVISPLDPRHPGALFARAVPLIGVTARLSHALNDELTVPMTFSCLRGSAGKAYWINTMDNLAQYT